MKSGILDYYYDKEKYREMVLDAAETVPGFLVLIELYMETLRKKKEMVRGV
jgi:predicted kinase